MQNAQQLQYLKVQVETASPGELTLLLYQETVRSLLKAKQLYAQGNYERMVEVLHKVRSIFNELIITLDLQYEISQNLKELYLFYNNYLAQFIINRDETLLDETLDFAKGMLETWKQAVLLVKSGKGN
ncbi:MULTISPECIES: flagellar export chaperone FliS [Paenibacillus]|uniref:Flagellar protein FliS n=2 Tax=Paenibacillus lactis TaxID=228574 RepID=G4HMC8_9BACL|nr:flagellar export chaperone FliS [Paenibacillus lactis]EHB54680.1 flagellar protein FliS [Paenibacillus lactis 154]MBP1891016.1 flagellar protein FliS [Paenibacillus lactis]HAF99077.1 flagellar export chaperone FliS [Paenibacillus lactis]